MAKYLCCLTTGVEHLNAISRLALTTYGSKDQVNITLILFLDLPYMLRLMFHKLLSHVSAHIIAQHCVHQHFHRLKLHLHRHPSQILLDRVQLIFLLQILLWDQVTLLNFYVSVSFSSNFSVQSRHREFQINISTVPTHTTCE